MGRPAPALRVAQTPGDSLLCGFQLGGERLFLGRQTPDGVADDGDLFLVLPTRGAHQQMHPERPTLAAEQRPVLLVRKKVGRPLAIEVKNLAQRF